MTFLQKNIHTGSFTIDVSAINNCKGILSIEVKPINRHDTLILDNIESDLISYKTPFVLTSPLPITRGVLNFKPYNSDANMQSVVRMLLVD